MPRRRKSFSRRRRDVDWVQNPEMYTPLSTEIGNTDVIVAGTLVYSRQILLQSIGPAALPLDRQSAAFAENTKTQVVRAVRGQVFVQPVETWASGTVREFAMRIGKFPQNPTDGAVVLNSPNYTLMEFLEPTQGAYVWADERFLWEHRMVPFFSPDNSETRPIYRVNVKWSGRCVLEDTEQLAMLFQNRNVSDFGNTGPVRVMTYIRCLVELPD